MVADVGKSSSRVNRKRATGASTRLRGNGTSSTRSSRSTVPARSVTDSSTWPWPQVCPGALRHTSPMTVTALADSKTRTRSNRTWLEGNTVTGAGRTSREVAQATRVADRRPATATKKDEYEGPTIHHRNTSPTGPLRRTGSTRLSTRCHGRRLRNSKTMRGSPGERRHFLPPPHARGRDRPCLPIAAATLCPHRVQAHAESRNADAGPVRYR